MAAGREISGLMALALVAFRGTERHETKNPPTSERVGGRQTERDRRTEADGRRQTGRQRDERTERAVASWRQ